MLFFSTEREFCRKFIELIEINLEYSNENLNKKLLDLSKNVYNFVSLSRTISSFIKIRLKKETTAESIEFVLTGYANKHIDLDYPDTTPTTLPSFIVTES